MTTTAYRARTLAFTCAVIAVVAIGCFGHQLPFTPF